MFYQVKYNENEKHTTRNLFVETEFIGDKVMLLKSDYELIMKQYNYFMDEIKRLNADKEEENKKSGFKQAYLYKSVPKRKCELCNIEVLEQSFKAHEKSSKHQKNMIINDINTINSNNKNALEHNLNNNEIDLSN